VKSIPVDELPRTPGQRIADEASELDHQIAVIQWANLQAKCGRIELELLYAVPNGMWTSPAQAGKAKASGLKSGVPDLHLPVSRGGFIGLWIEMKSARGRLQESQVWWHDRLISEGACVALCFNAGHAIDTLTEYLAGKHLRN
jgi:hypothetical protein